MSLIICATLDVGMSYISVIWRSQIILDYLKCTGTHFLKPHSTIREARSKTINVLAFSVVYSVYRYWEFTATIQILCQGMTQDNKVQF
jgi:hypothetical protein